MTRIFEGFTEYSKKINEEKIDEKVDNTGKHWFYNEINGGTMYKSFDDDTEADEFLKRLGKGWILKGIKESDDDYISEADKIKSDSDFKAYAEATMKKAHGDKYDQKIVDKMVADIIKKYDGNYGAMIGVLNSSEEIQLDESISLSRAEYKYIIKLGLTKDDIELMVDYLESAEMNIVKEKDFLHKFMQESNFKDTILTHIYSEFSAIDNKEKNTMGTLEYQEWLFNLLSGTRSEIESIKDSNPGTQEDLDVYMLGKIPKIFEQTYGLQEMLKSNDKTLVKHAMSYLSELTSFNLKWVQKNIDAINKIPTQKFIP